MYMTFLVHVSWACSGTFYLHTDCQHLFNAIKRFHDVLIYHLLGTLNLLINHILRAVPPFFLFSIKALIFCVIEKNSDPDMS